MAQYRIRQKYFSFKDSFAITDAYTGEPRFYCRSKVITLPKKFWVERTDGTPMYFVRQQMFRFLRHLDIYKGADRDGEHVATLKAKFSLFRKKCVVRSEQYGDFFIYGNIMAWDFSIYAGHNTDGELVATINKKISRIADTYDINILAGKEGFMLTLCIIIDYLYQKKH